MLTWAKLHSPNTPNQQFEYLVNWYMGRAKRRGWATTLPLLEEDVMCNELKAEIKKRWQK